MKKLNLQLVRTTFRQVGIKLFGARELIWYFHATPRSAALFLHRNAKQHYITQIRKDLYVFPDNQPDAFLIANRAYQPSYVSLETALSYYHMIPETVYTITSVTSKPTQAFDAAHLHLQYFKIKTAAFTGYSLKQLRDDAVLLAEPAKALADYFYFVSMGRKILNERLDLTRVTRTELEFYVQFFAYKPLNNLVRTLL